LDIFSPPPGDRDVISQALRDSSIETKIAPSSVRGKQHDRGQPVLECQAGNALSVVDENR
jgi:hypothetical protein